VDDRLSDSQPVETIQGSERYGCLRIRSKRLSSGEEATHFEKETRCSPYKEIFFLENQD
jgi:hypothetical protein